MTAVMTAVDPKRSSTARINGIARSTGCVSTCTQNAARIPQIRNLRVATMNQAIIKMTTPTLKRVQQVMSAAVCLAVAATAIAVEVPITTMRTFPTQTVTQPPCRMTTGRKRRRLQSPRRNQQPGSLIPRRSAKSLIVPMNDSTLYPIHPMVNSHPNRMPRQQ